MKRRFSAILLLVLFAALFACKTQVTPGSIEVQGVVMNKLTTSILVGATETLSVVVTPADAENKAVVWLTSATAVATVSAEGVVTALKEGTATITATTQEGGHTATCVVTVSSTAVSVTGVTLNHETATMVVGTTSALAATVAPENATNQNVSWLSSDEAVATVSAQGVVTGLKEGTATITATTQDGGYKTSCVVRVSNTVVAVTGVALNHETATMVVGATAALVATVAPENATNQNVSWLSSDEAVATVSADGVVTAVAEGSATITATTQDGAKTATCVVTVSNAVVLVTGVTLDQSTLSIESGSTATLVAAITPEDATNKNLDWSTSDVAVATVSAEGVVTAVAEGTATITVTTQDGSKIATCEVTVPIRALGALTQTPANNIAAEGVVATVSSPNATAGLVWSAALSNTVGFALGSVTGVGPLASVPVTVGVNPTSAVRSSTLTATATNGLASSLELTQAAGALTYVSASATTPVAYTATSVTFTVTGTAGLTLSFAKSSGDAAFSVPATLTCDGTAQTVTVAMAANTATTARQAVYTASVTNPGASGLDLTGITVKQEARPINPPAASDYVQIDKFYWTKGNLVAKNANECKVGAAADYGVYFQFGSLVGWTGGSGDGTGIGNPELAIQVKPADYGALSDWETVGRYTDAGTAGTGNGLPTTDAPTTGIGDPCRYYLGAPWRTPTAEDYLTLLGAEGANTNKAVPLKLTSYDLSFPASGYRNSTIGGLTFGGSIGFYWSSSVYVAPHSYSMVFSGSVKPQDNNPRSNGMPVRCVSE